MIETMIEDHLDEVALDGAPAPASTPPPRHPAEHGPQLVSAESLVRGRAA
jgi:hypothetical protein